MQSIIKKPFAYKELAEELMRHTQSSGSPFACAVSSVTAAKTRLCLQMPRRVLQQYQDDMQHFRYAVYIRPSNTAFNYSSAAGAMLRLKATAVLAGDAHTRKTWTGDYCSRTNLVPGCPQSNMEHSPVLCEINLLTIEHGINLLFELCPVCQIDKQLHRRKR